MIVVLLLLSVVLLAELGIAIAVLAWTQSVWMRWLFFAWVLFFGVVGNTNVRGIAIEAFVVGVARLIVGPVRPVRPPAETVLFDGDA